MKFFYTARSQTGETVTGTQEAGSEAELGDFLKQKGVTLLFAEKDKTSGGIGSYDVGAILDFIRGIPRIEKILFTRNLSVMVSSGMPLNRSLQTLARQTSSPTFRAIIMEVADEIAKGKGFGETLKKHPDVFSEIFISMIMVGETSGNLEEVLKILSEQMEKDNETRSQVVGSLIYPGVIITAMMGIGVFMMVYVVPQISGIFKEMNMELPVPTQIIVGMSDFLKVYWYYAIAGLAAFIYFFRAGLKTKTGKKLFALFLLKAPIASDIVKKVNAAQISRNLGSLLESGVSLTRSLEILGDSIPNYFFAESLREAKVGVEKGLTLSQVLMKYPDLYPPMVLEMVAIGEETGALTDLLVKVATFFEREVSQITKNMTSIIEPVLMVLIGGAVGFFAVSMLQPMYSLTAGIK
jgi:type IV pilus assembly protein PilC